VTNEGAVLGPVVRVGAGVVRTGTCSWADQTLVKDSDWYPARTRSAADRLRFYATQFPLVEVDSTYYAPPSERTASLWAERSPNGFTFNVKAYSLLTGHPTRAASLWRDLREGVMPDHRDQERIYAGHLEPAALEEAWRRFASAYVCVDAPATSGLERVLAVTHEPAVLRCHGRDDDAWTSRTASAAERFRYLYGEGELRELAAGARRLAGEAQETHVLMNNCYRDYAVRNAARLIELISRSP
jgi:uncharacterized protein YecE (DUF72 family)